MLLEPKDAARFRKAVRTPALWFAAIDLDPLIASFGREILGNTTTSVTWRFIDGPYLASVIHYGAHSTEVEVFVHNVLNRPETPQQVWKHIFIHELIHVVVPSRQIDGKLTHHPPEFWAMEERLSVDHARVWGWLWINFLGVLKHDCKKECVRVKRTWKKDAPTTVCTWADMDRWFGTLPKEAPPTGTI